MKQERAGELVDAEAVAEVVNAATNGFDEAEIRAWRRRYFGCADCGCGADEQHSSSCGWWDGWADQIAGALEAELEAGGPASFGAESLARALVDRMRGASS